MTRKKITIELADYEIDRLKRVGEVWKVNDANACVEDGDDGDGGYDVGTMAASLAANEALRLVQGYNSSKARHIGRKWG
jgi:hypothetical protein